MKSTLVSVFSPPFLFFLHEADFCLLSLFFLLPCPSYLISLLPPFIPFFPSFCSLCEHMHVLECLYIGILSNCHLPISLQNTVRYLRNVISFFIVIKKNAKTETKLRRPPELQKLVFKEFLSWRIRNEWMKTE